MKTSASGGTHNSCLVRRAALLTAAVTLAGLSCVAPASASGMVAGTADVTASADNSVKSIVRIGTRIFIGGTFTSINTPSGPVPRKGLAALYADTGALDLSWHADVNGEVLALAASPYGSTLYVGGTFTNVAGAARTNVAALSVSTGAVTAWNPGANYSVLVLASQPGKVLVGGKFTRIAGTSLGKLAMIDASTGRANTGFLPRPNDWVSALAFSPSGTGLYVGGMFTSLGGQYRSRLGAVSLSTGAASPWTPEANGCPVLNAVLSPAGSRIYVACAGNLGGNSVAAFDTARNGGRVWKGQADGNVQAVTLLGTTVYAGGHFATMNAVNTNYTDVPRNRIAAFDYSTGAMAPWAPHLNSALGVWALAASPQGVWAGGDFTLVNEVSQPYVARFHPIS